MMSAAVAPRIFPIFALLVLAVHAAPAAHAASAAFGARGGGAAFKGAADPPPAWDGGAPPKAAPALLDYKPVAAAKAVVVASDGWARFTVLTPSLVRMEYAADKAFDDRATLTVGARAPPKGPVG